MSFRYLYPLTIRHRDAITRLRQRQFKRRTGLTDRAVRTIDREWLSPSVQVAHDLWAIRGVDMAPNRATFADPVRGHKQPFLKDFALGKKLQVAGIQRSGEGAAVGKEIGKPGRGPAFAFVHQALKQHLFVQGQRHVSRAVS